jgi:hypothetical protein
VDGQHGTTSTSAVLKSQYTSCSLCSGGLPYSCCWALGRVRVGVGARTCTYCTYPERDGLDGIIKSVGYVGTSCRELACGHEARSSSIVRGLEIRLSYPSGCPPSW